MELEVPRQIVAGTCDFDETTASRDSGRIKVGHHAAGGCDRLTANTLEKPARAETGVWRAVIA